MLIVVRYSQSMLFPDGAESGQLSGDILTDLDGGRDKHGTEADGIVNKQLRPPVPAEDRVLHPGPGR